MSDTGGLARFWIKGEVMHDALSQEDRESVGTRVLRKIDGRWLIATLKFTRGFDVYQGLDRQDIRYAGSAAITYKLNREFQLKGEVRREWRHHQPVRLGDQICAGSQGL